MSSLCALSGALCTHQPRVSSVSKRNYTGFSVVHSGNWPLLSLAAQLLCTPDPWLGQCFRSRQGARYNRLPSAAQCPGQPSLRAKSENVKLNDKIDRILCAQTAHKQLNIAEKVEKHHLELLHIFRTLQKSE